MACISIRTMHADITLYLVVLLLCALWGTAWLVVGQAIKTVSRASYAFLLGNALSAAAVYLLVQRTTEPSYLHYQAVEWLMFVSFLAWHGGILALAQFPQGPSLRSRLLPVVLAFGITVWVAPDASSFQIRATVFSFTLAWLAGMCFRDAYRGLVAELFPALARWAISICFGVIALAMLSRGVVTVLSAPPLLSPDDFVPVPNFTPFLWLLTVMTMMVNIALAGLLAGRHILHINSLADRDDLTGALSRRAWVERLQQECARQNRVGESLACIFIDLDHFKTINDRFGHGGGDEALRQVARVLQFQLRTIDVLGRLGEEFMVLMPHTSLAGACEAAQRLQLCLAATPLKIAGQDVVLTASVGVTTKEPADAASDVMRRADLAMYEAKRKGRNRVEVGVLDGVPIPLV